jgi:hypothetical protein
VPLSVQHVLAADGFVGRLAFDGADDYRAYAEKVQRWEDHPSPARAGDAILHTVHDDTPATRRGHDTLMTPGQRILARRRDLGDVRVAEIRATGTAQPAPEELMRAVAGAGDRPAVLFTLGHGAGAPRAGWPSTTRQRCEQGALSFGRGGLLSGRDLAGRTFLAGGMWVALACFGAGTPDSSDYLHWLQLLGRDGHVRDDLGHVRDSLARERPFVAGLPKAALASPDGPLAFIGHVDLAWAYSFLELDDRPMPRPGRLMGVIQSLLHGDRAGVALRYLTRFFAEVNTELTALDDGHTRAGRSALGARERLRRGHLWMLRQDLAGWMLLGDPAVRLPLAGATPARPSAAPGDVDAVEAAVCAVLGGARLADVSTAHGLDASVLARLVARYREAGRRALARSARHLDTDGP